MGSQRSSFALKSRAELYVLHVRTHDHNQVRAHHQVRAHQALMRFVWEAASISALTSNVGACKPVASELSRLWRLGVDAQSNRAGPVASPGQ